MKTSVLTRTLAVILSCILLLSVFSVLCVSAEETVKISDGKLTQIVFGEIYTDDDKGTAFDGNLYLEKNLGPAYFDGVRNGDRFEFKINVEKAGDYHFCFSFGWVEATGIYAVSVDGGDPIHLQNTVKGLGWRDWIDSSEAQVSLTAGEHTVRVTMGCDGPNLYSMKIAPVGVALSQGATNIRATLCDESTTRGAEQIGQSSAVQFNSTVPFAGMSLTSASWNNNIGSIRMSLFKWDTSYDKTLGGTPIASEDFVDFADNLTLKFLFDEVAAGEYLLYMENITGNTTEAVGYWGYAAARENVRVYKNNAESDFCPGLSILCGEEVAEPFAPISEMDPNASDITKTEGDMYPNGDMIEYKLNADSKYGVQFKTSAAFGGCEVYIPTVPVGDNTLTLELYKWNGNYSESVKASPVAAKTFQNLPRKNWVSLTGDFGAGEYLFVIRNGTMGMTVGMVEAPSAQANHYLYTSKAGVSFVARLIGNGKLEAPTVPAAQDFITNDASMWVGTDGLNRDLTTFDQASGVREGKYVGIFYHTWHAGHAWNKLVNVQKLVDQYPEAVKDYKHAAWGDSTICFWNEPIYGYYNNGVDRYVLRKQAELLADAGVDVVFFDNTNGTENYMQAILTLCEVWAEARADGVKTPQISCMLNMYEYGDTAKQLIELYDVIYSKGLYQDLWFYWEDKPLMLGYPDHLKKMDRKDVLDFFSYRPIDPGYTVNRDLILDSDVSDPVRFSPEAGFERYTQWKWISIYPQQQMKHKKTREVEQMCVSVAQNWSAKVGLTPMNAGDHVFGRGYTDKYGVNTSDEAVMAGLNIAEQWEYVLEVDPTFVYITGWNEWVAGRYESMWGEPNAIPDNALDGYSRDIEPSTGMLKDHFYNQMVSYIRRFKGVAKQEAASPAVTDSAAIDWSAVTPVYRTYAHNTVARDYDGYKGYHYENNTGRNDFVESRVTYDSENLYFYVKTADAITPHTDPAWMRLFIDVADVKGDKNWETFEYMINRENPTADKATLERSTGGWNWEKAAEVSYKVEGNTMVVTIPRAALGIDEGDFTVNFKWSDNMQTDGDIMDFYVSGDVAPGARFKYSFTTIGAMTDAPEIPEETESVSDTEPTAEPDTHTNTGAETEAETTISDGTSMETQVSESGGCQSMLATGSLIAWTAAASVLALRKRREE